MTFSIIARCPETGRIGAAVASFALAVGPRIVLARAGVGAVAVQASGRLQWRQQILDSLAAGMTPEQAINLIRAETDVSAGQLAAVGTDGDAYAFTGPECEGSAGHHTDREVTVQANTMVSTEVWPAMLDAFHADHRALEHRLVTALQAGDRVGGDLRGRQAAAVLVVSPDATFVPTGAGDDPTVDLRVDDSPDPVTDLARLLKVMDAHRELIRAGMASDPDAVTAHVSRAYAIAPDDPKVATQYAQHAAFAFSADDAVNLALAAQRANPNVLDMLRRRIGAAKANGDSRAQAVLEWLDRTTGHDQRPTN